MSIKSLWQWFVGDDAPLGPESERGLFNHFNRPESLPWPPADGPIVGNRPKQFRPPVSDPSEQDYQWGDRENHSSAAYYHEEQRRFFEEERRKHVVWLNDTFKRVQNDAAPKPVDPAKELVPCPAHLCGTDIGFCGLCGLEGAVTREIADDYWKALAGRSRATGQFRVSAKHPVTGDQASVTITDLAPEPRELKPTVGSILVPTLDGPPKRVPICHRPQRVEEAVFAGNIHPDLYEYIVHLEAHYARTAHHGE